MIHVIASIKVKPGRRAELVEAFKKNVPNVLAEDGCVEYTPAVDIESGIPIQAMDADVLTVVEKWESLEALQAHLEAPHMAKYQEETADLTEGVEISVLQNA